jgi:hypothetical protein
MAFIREIKEWFLRHGTASTDRETSFKKQYTSGSLLGNYKTFLTGDYPSLTIFQKLFASIAFKLNTNDTAFEQQAGLVQKATDAKAIARTSTDNQVFEQTGSTPSGSAGISTDTVVTSGSVSELNSSYFTTAVLPHQLPNIVNDANVDGTDTAGTAVTKAGLTVTPLTVALTSPTGRTRKNFKLAVAPAAASALYINGSGELDTNSSVTGSYTFVSDVTYNAFGQVTAVTKKTVVVKQGIITSIT